MRPLGWGFFLSPSLFALVIFLLAFSDAVTLTLENGDIGMVGEPVQQGCDASGIRKNSVPVLEGEIGSQDDGTSRVVARIDDVEEEVGGVFVVGEIAKLVDAEQLWSKVLSQTLAVWSKYSNAQQVSNLHLSKGRLNPPSRSNTYSSSAEGIAMEMDWKTMLRLHLRIPK